jgi:cytosine/adenosine deaminase-related metal-dependent hydrolase
MRTSLFLAVLITDPIMITSQQRASTNVVVIRDVRVFDGERTIEHINVVVQDDRIQTVGREGHAVETADATIVEGRGRTLLPGLIDSHVHIADDAHSAVEQAIVMGVTTVLDMFSGGERLKTLKRVAAEDSEGLADARTAGTGATAPGGHPTQMGGPVTFPTVASTAEADAFVDARIAEGADYIKIIYDDLGKGAPMVSRRTLDALVSAAHRRGKLAVVHVRAEPHTRGAIEAGADVLAHLFRGPTASLDFGTFAAKYRVAFIPTLSAICANSEAQGLLTDAHLSPFLRPAWRQTLEIPIRLAPCGGAEAAIKQLIDTQVPILAGTDAPIPGTTYGASLHGELSLLVRSGLSPSQALAAATSVPARIFRLNDRGSIRTGLRADLVLVDGDPTRDILATRRIVGVWKRGIAVKRAQAELKMGMPW